MPKKLLDLIGHGSTIWTLAPAGWQAAISAGLGAVSGYFAYGSGGIAWAIFIATGVFAFTACGLYFVYLFRGFMNIFERLVPKEVGIMQASTTVDPEKTVFVTGLTLRMIFKNEGMRPIYMRILRCYHSVQGQTQTGAVVDQQIHTLVPGAESGIILPTLGKMRLEGKPLKGEVDLEAEYGPTKDNLCYVLKYKGAPQIGFQTNMEAGQTIFRISTAVILQIHERK